VATPPVSSSKEAATFNRLYKRGWDLSRGELLLDPRPHRTKPGWFARRRLRRAIESFKQALAIHPQSWQSLWALGKIHQRLGASRDALECFARAHSLNPTHADVAGEAAITAMEIGSLPEALTYARAAVEQAPNHAGHLSNLALALLLHGENGAALQTIRSARQLAPFDSTAETVEARIEDVIAGKRAPPQQIRDFSL
jgi:tetratricopeptide (TPR) repeat protein